VTALELFSIDWRAVWADSPQESVGVVFTRPEVVDLILDLAGYRVGGSRLAERAVLEPSCGDGAFLDAIVHRLIESERQHADAIDWTDPLLDLAVCAADISEPSLVAARELILARLCEAGCPKLRAVALTRAWTLHTDFLLHDWDRRFEVVVGNPPYVRLEDLPKGVLQIYRERFATLTDRADLYVAFFERGLHLLSESGSLAFIVANRFTKNQYGAALRKLIARQYHVRHYINLEHTQPFIQDVSAYPSIVVLDRQVGRPTLATTLSDCSPPTLTQVEREARESTEAREILTSFTDWYPDGSPWQTTSRRERDLLAELAERFPVLEESAPLTKVGIGVATGADDLFVLPEKHPAIEDSRQIPLLMAGNVAVDGLTWSGHYLVNPFDEADDGSLVDLSKYPGLRAYFESGGERLRKRHVAKARPANWYRTIDRVWPKLQAVPKLVIPDIQGGGVVGFDRGDFYPHHNLYWISSAGWDLRALQAILRSSLVLAQVRAFSVQMRGGSLRYQAQTLRRIRVPLYAELSASCVAGLVAASGSADQDAIDAAVTVAFAR
jgi:methylase of polypeptide subunit release factors